MNSLWRKKKKKKKPKSKGKKGEEKRVKKKKKKELVERLTITRSFFRLRNTSCFLIDLRSAMSPMSNTPLPKLPDGRVGRQGGPYLA